VPLFFMTTHTRFFDFRFGTQLNAVDLPVVDPDHAIADGEHVRIVGGADDGDAIVLVQAVEQLMDFVTGLEIEIGSGLIAQQQRGVVGE
jgi:hypothetical protein